MSARHIARTKRSLTNSFRALQHQLSTDDMAGGEVYLDAEIKQELDMIARKDSGISRGLVKQAVAGKISMTSEENKACMKIQRAAWGIFE